MSKLYANLIITEKKFDSETIRSEMIRIGVKARYTDYNKSFHFSCMSMFRYIKSGGEVIESENFSVQEFELLQMINFDKRYSNLNGDAMDEISAHSEILKHFEKDDLEMGWNHYMAISFIQKYFTLSKFMLGKIKTQRHLWKLARVDTPYFTLTPIPINRHGGRPMGSKRHLSDEEHKALLENLSRYDAIVKKYVEGDFLEKFVFMHKEFNKLPKKELPDLLKRGFMDTKKGIINYFYALRYEFKRSLGIPNKKIVPGAEELCELAKIYDFPFAHTGIDVHRLVEKYGEWTRNMVKNEEKDDFVFCHKKMLLLKKDLPQEYGFIKRPNIPELLYEIMRCDYCGTKLDDMDAIRALYYYGTAKKNPIFSKYIHLIPKDFEGFRIRKGE